MLDVARPRARWLSRIDASASLAVSVASHARIFFAAASCQMPHTSQERRFLTGSLAWARMRVHSSQLRLGRGVADVRALPCVARPLISPFAETMARCRVVRLREAAKVSRIGTCLSSKTKAHARAYERRPVGPRRRRTIMAVKIDTDSCIACGACVDTCPVEALSVQDYAVVNEDECIECGACTSSCPVDALSL